jgi:hypothetical protein
LVSPAARVEALVVRRCPHSVGGHPLVKQVLHGPGALVGGGPRACAGPSRPLRRRENAPKAQGERLTDWAALRKACAARWRCFIVRCCTTVPLELSCWGASPRQEQQCFSSGYVRIAVPISAPIVWASVSLLPCLATRATPVIRRICARVCTSGAFVRPWILYEHRTRRRVC